MSNEQAIRHFQAAREHYLARRFAEARATMQRYRQTIDYAQFEQTDCRNTPDPQITVVIVSYQTNQALLDCLDSVFNQQGPSFEIILVDNGGNQSVHTALAKLPLLWIKPPINLLPSEGRNIGAHFARGDLLVFLDDDALMASGYLAAACKTMADESILALRGRILPKTATPAPSQPQHYDLGDTPQLAELNLEGNSVIRRKAYSALKGFDPLLFGHEGKELTLRCRSNFPNQKILYWPALVIHHDYAQEQQLAAKRERQALAKDYLHYLKENTLSAGVTILVRAGDKIAAADEFLASLVKHNTYKPIEVLLATTNSQLGLELVRAYLGPVRIRLLATTATEMRRIAETFRFDQILIVDLPFVVGEDILKEVISGQVQIDQVSSVGRGSLQKLGGVSLFAPLSMIAGKRAETAKQVKASAGLSGESNAPEESHGTRRRLARELPPSFATAEMWKPILGGRRTGPRTIGGMATIPERQPSLREVLSKLAPQFDELHVYLNNYQEKPPIGDLRNVVLHLSDTHGDLGAKGKFFGLNFAASDDYYFSLDDDFLYPDDYVATMKNAMARYNDAVAVCVHGSVFGNPLDWYFERISTFSARQGLECDRFVNLAGTGTFACRLSTLPIQFLDVMPRTMCDLQISIGARKLKVPLVSIKRGKNWLRSITVDSVSANGDDYWSKMLKNDEGRTVVARKVAWDFISCKQYILDALRKTNVPLDDHDRLLSDGFDVAFLDAVNRDGVPVAWNSETSEVYFLRKYQYYASLLDGGRSGLSKNEILCSPNFENLAHLRALALECKGKWELSLHE